MGYDNNSSSMVVWEIKIPVNGKKVLNDEYEVLYRQ
jgi:hypothetical protein